MRRMIGAGALGLFLLMQAGCIAVTSKEISSGTRYDAVSVADGRIYVVDKKCRTAREVTIVPAGEPSDP
jgi:hypothetical protein